MDVISPDHGSRKDYDESHKIINARCAVYVTSRSARDELAGRLALHCISHGKEIGRAHV